MHKYSQKIRMVVLSTVLSALFPGMLNAQMSEENRQTLQTAENQFISIVAVGDIMMGSTYPVISLPPDDGKGLFTALEKELKKGDIVFGNLEGPFVDNGLPVKCKSKSPFCFEFLTPTRYVAHLKDAGFTTINIANNHTFDCGIKGVDNTISVLRSAGIEAIGGINTTRIFLKNKSVVFAGFSFTLNDHAYSINDIDTAKNIVKKLKDENDIVIVSFHGGSEGKSATRLSGKDEMFLGENRGNVTNFSRSIIDVGADLVLGHGPHVLRALELYKGKFIAYSLGNFLTYKLFNTAGPNSLSVILTLRINAINGDFIDGTLIPLKLNRDGLPEIDPSGEAIALLKRLSREDIRDNPLLVDEKNGSISPL